MGYRSVRCVAIARMNFRFRRSGTSQRKRIATCELSSSRSSDSQSVRVNSAPSSSFWNSAATAPMPEEMKSWRNCRGFSARCWRRTASCVLNEPTVSERSSSSSWERAASSASRVERYWRMSPPATVII